MSAFAAYVNGRVRIILTRVGAETGSRVAEASNELQTSLNVVLSGGRSGRRYGAHQASAPGEPPANWHGTLRLSFRPESKWNGTDGEACVKSNMLYAPFLEHGTSKMSARPYREKVIQNAMPQMLRIFNRPY